MCPFGYMFVLQHSFLVAWHCILPLFFARREARSSPRLIAFDDVLGKELTEL